MIAAFGLSDRQAEDILEIRLRQLARLEKIKIEQELSELRDEKAKLEELLGSEPRDEAPGHQGNRRPTRSNTATSAAR